MVKVSPGDQWTWLMLDSQGSRPDFRCGQGVKHENLLGQDLNPSCGWKYRCLCSVPPLPPPPPPPPPTGHSRGLDHICVLISCPLGIFGGLIPGVILDLSSYHSAFACWLHDHCAPIYSFNLLLCTIRKCTAYNTYSVCMLARMLTFDPQMSILLDLMPVLRGASYM